MIASENAKTQVLVSTSVWDKLKHLDADLEFLLQGQGAPVPEKLGRDVQIWPIRDLPPKKGLSLPEGQARLLHDLASIELQAMELAVRTLMEFPEAPGEFREQLSEIAREEGLHLRLCLEGLESLGFPWGSFPTHLGLWQSVAGEDSLLDRVLIVHRYLEGAGLDASDTILRRLSGVRSPALRGAIEVIRRDEVGHVEFGSRWYRRLLGESGGDPEVDFASRLSRLFARLPRRLEPIRRDLRETVGFSSTELDVLEEFRQRWLGEGARVHP